MHMIGKRRAGWLIGAMLLLALPVAEARRDADDAPRYERAQPDARAERRAPRRDPGNAVERYDGGRGRDEVRYERGGQRAAGMSLSQAVAEAERRTGGRVLSAEPREDGGRVYYRVKVLAPDGRVQILTIDAL